MKHTAVIQNWFIHIDAKYGPRICGKVYGHNKIPDGHHIISSSIQEIREEEVITLNTVYKLGLRANLLSAFWKKHFKTGWELYDKKNPNSSL